MDSEYYVYKHINKSTNEVFYVGKGKGNRAWSSDSRNKFWHNIVNKHGYYIEIIEDGLTESAAFSLEIETIKFYKLKKLCKANLTDGGEGLSGFSHSDETKLKLSKYKGQLHHGLGKSRSDSDRLKMSIGRGGQPIIVFEAIRKFVENPGKGKVHYEKGVIIGIWPCQSLCAEALSLSRQSINNCLKNKKPTAGGFIFEYYNPTETPI